MAQKPSKNVLLITADQWRIDCLSAQGHPCVKTPNIDKLISSSVLFQNHYTVCAPCGPSRASLLTGLYAQNHRSVRNGTPLDSRHDNLAHQVRAAGYDPMLFGYTDTALDPRDTPIEDFKKYGYEGPLPGFNSDFLLMESNPAPWLEFLKSKGYDIPANVKDLYKPVKNYPGAESKGRTYAPPVYSAEHSMTAFSTGQVIDHIGERNDGWFVHLSYLRPHPPYIAPEPYNSMYDANDMPPPVRADTVSAQREDHPWLASALSDLGEWHNPWMLNDLDAETYERDVRQLQATYFGLVTKVDHYIGQLIDHLKSTGAYDNTLIVLTSDHGEMLGDRYLFGKKGYFDSAYHIPLIIRDPDASADNTRGRRITHFTESVDVMPTILDKLDLDVPRQCDGHSLMGFVSGNEPHKWRQEVHFEFDFREVVDRRLENHLGIDMDECTLNVIQDEDFKYVHFAALRPLLYDQRKDPDNSHNLADDPAYTGTMLSYAQKLLSWRMRHDERVLSGTLVTRDGVFERP